MSRWFSQFRVLKNKVFLTSITTSILLLLASLVVNFLAGVYAAERSSNAVTDVILSNIPAFDVGGLFTYGSIVFWLFISFLCLEKPQRIPFTLKSIALFTIVRSFFITLTHIGPFPTQVQIDPSRIIEKFTSGSDLFFSGHTGLPFLMALVYWQHKKLRLLFIGVALLFGAVVLLGHLHYSIDVFAAFFITYSIFHIAEHWFASDQEVFEKGVV